MKLPNFKKIFKNDYEEDFQDLVEQLAEAVNYNFERLFNVLNNRASFGDNLYGQLKEFTVTVGTDGIPLETTSYQSTLNPARPVGALVLDLINETNPNSYPTSAPFITYSESSGTVTINHITGLIANNKYKIKIFFLG